jgi:hypothetical protein
VRPGHADVDDVDEFGDIAAINAPNRGASTLDPPRRNLESELADFSIIRENQQGPSPEKMLLSAKVKGDPLFEDSLQVGPEYSPVRFDSARREPGSDAFWDQVQKDTEKSLK